jgi:hypothetical protein
MKIRYKPKLLLNLLGGLVINTVFINSTMLLWSGYANAPLNATTLQELFGIDTSNGGLRNRTASNHTRSIRTVSHSPTLPPSYSPTLLPSHSKHPTTHPHHPQRVTLCDRPQWWGRQQRLLSQPIHPRIILGSPSSRRHLCRSNVLGRRAGDTPSNKAQ